MATKGLRVLVYPQTGGTWTARGLEHDISAEARTVEAAVDALVRIIRAHVAYDRRHKREPLSAFAAAPRRFREAFAYGTRHPDPIELDLPFDDVAARPMVAIVPHHPGVGLFWTPRRTA